MTIPNPSHQNTPSVTDGVEQERPPVIPQPHGGALKPFVKGDPRADAGRRKAVAVRKERAALERARVKSLRETLSSLIEVAPRDQLGPSAAACAQHLVGQVVAGEVPIRHAEDAAALIKVLVDVARLEEGQHTGATIVGHADTDAMLERVRALREQAQHALADFTAHHPEAVELAAGDQKSPDDAE